jgi:hypothetical protein
MKSLRAILPSKRGIEDQEPEKAQSKKKEKEFGEAGGKALQTTKEKGPFSH